MSETETGQVGTSRTVLWHDTRTRRFVAALAINFKGRHGMTLGEERFLAQRLHADETGVLLDVGANEGTYARRLRALCPKARVFAFEPHPRTFASLVASTAYAGTELLNVAMGASAGRMTLYDFADADGSTQASLNRDAVALFSDDVVAHGVDVTTIDQFMAERGIERVALLKIDTEGHDLAVLQGAVQAIARQAIDAIQFEFIPANVATRVFVRDFFDILVGYRLHRLCLNGTLLPLPVYDVKRCEIFVTHNLVALPVRGPG